MAPEPVIGDAKSPKGCAWWMPKKRRFCASPALHNSEFCGNHRSSDELKRVACPLDPSHTVLETDVESHVKKCSAAKHLNHLENQPYFCHHINAGSDEEDDSLPSSGHQSLDQKNRSSGAKRLDVSGMPSDQFAAFVRRIERAHDECALGNDEESFLQPSECSNWWNPERDRRLPFQEKHALQQASMLGNVAAFGLIKAESGKSNSDGGGIDEVGRTECDFVEFGAGRGYLSHMLCDSYGVSSLVLIERRAYKFKADRTLRLLLGVSVERLRIDIEDLSISGIRSLRGRQFVAVSKHLCGPATDLTLRCCLNGRRASSSNHPASEARLNEPDLKGIGIATCCHHLCQWRSYVNKGFFRRLGFCKTEFNMITWLTSWAVNSDGEHENPEVESRDGISTFRDSDDRDEDFVEKGKAQERSVLLVVGEPKNHLPEVMRKMDQTERVALGRKCKDLLDHGRVLWLTDCGLHVKIVKYVPTQITPENKLLLARVRF